MGFDEEVRDGGEESLSAEYIQSALCICKLEPTESESHLYSTILYTGLEHWQILVSQESPGTNTLWILKDDCITFFSGETSTFIHSVPPYKSRAEQGYESKCGHYLTNGKKRF